MKRLVVLGLIILLAGSLPWGGLDAGRERIVEKSFEVKSGKTLDIELDTGGDVIVTGWNKKLVAVKARITGRDMEDVDLEFDETRKGVEIHAERDSRWKSNKSDVHLEISVPDEFDVTLDTKGGDVMITGIHGVFEGKTYGGDLEFRDLKGKIRFTTMGGDILVEHSEVDGSVKTMGGDVEIRDVVGDIRGNTMGGDVTYDNVRGRGEKSKGRRGEDEEVSITTMGGDINVDYPDKKVKLKTFGGDIDIAEAEEVSVTTLGGDIKIEDAPIGAKVSTMGGDITIQSAGGYARAKTMGGDIEIKAIDGWVKASTMGGDIDVTMVGDPEKGRRDVELKSMGGDIELVVPADLSMEFDIELAYTKNHEGKYRIESDFNMKIEESKEWVRKWGQKRKYIYGTGEVNGGKHKITIRTVNGDITIKKGT